MSLGLLVTNPGSWPCARVVYDLVGTVALRLLCLCEQRRGNGKETRVVWRYAVPQPRKVPRRGAREKQSVTPQKSVGVLAQWKTTFGQGRIVIAEPGITRDHGTMSIYVLQCKHAQRVGPELADVGLVLVLVIGANAMA
jgi:hypothetical protein